MALGDVWQLLWKWQDSDILKDRTTRIRVEQVSTDDPVMGDVDGPMEDFWDAIKANFSSNLVLTLLELRAVHPNTAVLYTKVEAVAGTGSADMYDPSAAIVTSMRTAKAGRSYRGRSYLPSPSPAAVTASSDVGTGVAGAIKGAWEDLDAALVALPHALEPVVMSLQHNGSAVFETNRILLYEVDVNLRSQRRRQTRAPAYV